MAASIGASSPPIPSKRVTIESPRFSPSSDKRLWSNLRSRVDTLLENKPELDPPILDLKKELKEDPLSESKKKINSGVGFRHVIDLLFSEQKLIDKMRKKLAELFNGETDLEALVDPMPLQLQMDIIDEIMDRRKEKGTRGPPKPIQAFLDIHEELEMTREELRKEQIEAAKKEESRALIQSLAERIKALEDKSSGNAARENA